MMGQINNQRIAIVIFPSLPMGMESAVQFVGEAFRLSRSWARVNSQSISSAPRSGSDGTIIVTGYMRLIRGACPQRVALFNLLMECERRLVFPRNVPCEMLNVSLSITAPVVSRSTLRQTQGPELSRDASRTTLHSQGRSYMRVMTDGHVGAG